MFTIKVPATSANMGPGFDSLGMAVNLYLKLTVVKESDEWFIEHDFDYLPKNERNLIIKIANKVCSNLKPHHLILKSDIPMTRGLGSSSSAIVAGIELANQLGQLNLSLDTKMYLATKFEGHPDNVAPALVGNMVVSVSTNQHVLWSKIKLKDMVAVAVVPKTPLATKESRGVLPETLPLMNAAFGSAISNVLVAHLSRGYYKHLKKLIERDVFHEPFRQQLVPDLLAIRQLLARELTYGTYLSGAGPTIMTLIPYYQQHHITQLLQKHFPQHDVLPLRIDYHGTTVTYHDDTQTNTYNKSV